VYLAKYCTAGLFHSGMWGSEETGVATMEETLRRRLMVMSSLNDVSMDQLGNRVGVGSG
jgi:hypothetical protein